MFGFLRKKKPSNAVDEFIFATYGNPPPSKRANLERATSLAFEELLIGNVEQQSVRVVAEEIYAGPIPFSTHDLALSVAINFFKRPDFMPHLREAQILARIKMLEWLEDKLVVPVIVKNFEEVLHTLYKPAHPTFVPEVKAIKRLVELVERKASTALGPFEDLNRDLGAFIEKNHETCSPMVKMAYAYARRTAMAGLFFQGIVGENVVKHVQDIFQGLQNLTGQTIDFQREASSQADEIVMSYVPRATEEHTRVLVNFAREGVTAIKMANTAGIDFDIDELEEDSVRIDTCIHLIDRVIEVSKTLGMALRSDVNPNSQKRLIDVVEKTSEAKLGAFASMCEDVKLSAPSYRGDSILFPASGYALILGSCGAFVAGGVHPKLISDFSALAKILLTDIGTDPEIHRICREQAIQLASTYVHKLTAASAEVIVEMGLKLHAFIEDGESRLSPEEVVLRANRIARDRASLEQPQPTGSDTVGKVDGSYLKKSIAQNGWTGAITISAMMVIDRISNREIAYQFLLEELDGARQGNEASQAAARRSGISPKEYIGTLNRSRPEVDGPDGPQQLLMKLSFQLADDQELMAKFRCDVGRAVQEHFKLGQITE